MAKDLFPCAASLSDSLPLASPPSCDPADLPDSDEVTLEIREARQRHFHQQVYHRLQALPAAKTPQSHHESTKTLPDSEKSREELARNLMATLQEIAQKRPCLDQTKRSHNDAISKRNVGGSIKIGSGVATHNATIDTQLPGQENCRCDSDGLETSVLGKKRKRSQLDSENRRDDDSSKSVQRKMRGVIAGIGQADPRDVDSPNDEHGAIAENKNWTRIPDKTDSEGTTVYPHGISDVATTRLRNKASVKSSTSVTSYLDFCQPLTPDYTPVDRLSPAS